VIRAEGQAIAEECLDHQRLPPTWVEIRQRPGSLRSAVRSPELLPGPLEIRHEEETVAEDREAEDERRSQPWPEAREGERALRRAVAAPELNALLRSPRRKQERPSHDAAKG